jgi:AraC-like DNA-binding protein
MIGKTRQQLKTRVEEVFDPDLGEPRGILRWPPPTGQYKHLRKRPPSDLAQWIDLYWMVTWNLPKAYLQETLPHPNFNLAFENGDASVFGVSTGRFATVLEGKSGVFGVKFRPGAFRPFMKAAAASLLNRVVPAKSIFGKSVGALQDVWESSNYTEDKMIKAANEFFRARLPKPDPTVELADQIVRCILEDHEIRTVEDLVSRTGIGKRSLQRIFNEYVGVNPKWVIRRDRLHELIKMFQSGHRLDWAQLAVDLGYFDQAHLINDFRSVVGFSPIQYEKQIDRNS